MKYFLGLLLSLYVSTAYAANPQWGGANSNTPPFTVITVPSSAAASFTVNSLNSLKTVILWKSGVSQAKALSLKGCSAADKGIEVEVVDGDSNTTTYPITITPTSGTINSTSTATVDSSSSSVSLVCDGVSNWAIIGLPVGGMRRDATNATIPTAINSILGNTTAHTYYAPAYGSCTWNATNDVATCINAAITAANAAGGGTVVVPSGTLGQTTSLVLKDKVHVQFAGGANFGQCGSILKWIGDAGGIQVTAGSDASAVVIAGTGLKGTCLDGNGLAAVSIKWRSVNYSKFTDIYAYGVTTDGFDIDVGATVNRQNAFNTVEDVYIDLTQASSINANVMTIGPGTASANTNRNRFVNFIGIYQNGKGIICGNADSNDFNPAHIEDSSATPGVSVQLLGHASDIGRTCRSNRFVGEFGTGGDAASRFTAENNTFPSVNNYVFLNSESGAPAANIVAGATLFTQSNIGSLAIPQLIKLYGTAALATTDYTFVNDSTGDLFINRAAGKAIHFRAGTTTDQITLAANGLLTVRADIDPVATLYRPNNAGNFHAGLSFDLNNSANAQKTYASISGMISSNTAAAENGNMSFLTIASGTLAERMRLFSNAGIAMGSVAETKTPCAGCIVTSNNSYLQIVDTGNTARGVIGLDASNVTLLTGGSGGLLVRTNNTAATAFSVDAGASKLLLQFGAASNIPVHIGTAQTTAPALSVCGTTPAIVGTDEAGEVTMGTGTPTGCVITFNQAYVSAPMCVVTWQATPLASQSYTVSNSAITLVQTATDSNKVNYICRARAGG